MSSTTISLIVFGCVFGGALLGIFLHAVLPQHHLGNDSKDIVKLGMGLVGTMAALVLGLLVASAKSSFDPQRSELAPPATSVRKVLRPYGRASSGAGRSMSTVFRHRQTWFITRDTRRTT